LHNEAIEIFLTLLEKHNANLKWRIFQNRNSECNFYKKKYKRQLLFDVALMQTVPTTILKKPYHYKKLFDMAFISKQIHILKNLHNLLSIPYKKRLINNK